MQPLYLGQERIYTGRGSLIWLSVLNPSYNAHLPYNENRETEGTLLLAISLLVGVSRQNESHYSSCIWW